MEEVKQNELSKKITPDEKIKKLKEKQQKILNQIRNEENKLKAKNRKIDTRQKVLLGAFIKYSLRENKEFSQNNIHIEFDKFLTKEMDKKLFDFSSKENFLESFIL